MPPCTDTDAALFEQLRPRMKAISARIVGSEAEAEDVIQDCFFKWQCVDLAALATPAAWLTTVVQRQSVDRLRRRARDGVAARNAMALAPEVQPLPPEDHLLRLAELGEALGQLLAQLSPAERLALVLRAAFECSHADIAAALGTTPVNARQYLARARRRLREDRPAQPASEKLCRALLLRFQAAINDFDMPSMVSLLGAEQPVSVLAAPGPGVRVQACANDAVYCSTLAA